MQKILYMKERLDKLKAIWTSESELRMVDQTIYMNVNNLWIMG